MTPEGKTDFLKEAARRLGTFEEELERNNYIEAVAEEYQVDMGSLKKLVSKTAMSGWPGATGKQTKIYTADRKAERSTDRRNLRGVLLTWMIESRKLFGIIKKYITSGRFYNRAVSDGCGSFISAV